MNSLLASNINGGFNNQQVANGSSASVLLSSIDFTVTDRMTNYSSSQQGKSLIKLTDSEDILCNGQNKTKNYDQNKNKIENYVSVNGNDKSEDSIPVPKLQLFTGKIDTEWKQVYKIGAGLSNLGNTCFMNTVIQCLTYCPPLANYLLNENDHISSCKIAGFCMMCLLQRHMKKTIGKTGEIFKPVDIYQRLRLIAKHFQFGRQEDAHEFLRYVIDHLWKACLSQVNGVKLDSASKETTVINKIFGGYHRSQVICMRCKKKSNTFDHFMDFILDIKQNVVSLEKALEKFIQPELLQQENSYKCPKCKMKVEAQKRFSVFQAPLVATFQLKRFDYNRSFGGKITKQITYPEKLNLRPYMSDTQGDPVWYRLNAVLVHSGPSCNAGHYYCYVRNSNSCWYIMDDTRVHQVSLNQVLNQSAYVLFYIKMENSEKTSLKKCLDSKNAFMKGTTLPKIAEINNVVKPIPLSDSNSPISISKPYNSPNSMKKFNSFVQPNREKISFGFRGSATSTQVSSPKNKTSSSETVSVKRSGLVPYMEDSSESSDASESYSSQNKSNSIASINGEYHPKVGSLDSYKNSPQLEVKVKLSKSHFSSPSYNFINNAPLKVSATDTWIVTDAPQTPISSSSSSTAVNSTTNWHVIEASDLALNNSSTLEENNSSNTKESLGSPKEIKNNSLKETVCSSNESNSIKETLISLKECKNNSIKESLSSLKETKNNCVKESFDSSKISISEMSPSKYLEKANNSCHNLSSDLKLSNSSENSSSAENCDFRKQIPKSKSYFSENDEISSIKRKYCDSNSKIPKDSPKSEYNESRCSPVSKKIKYSENSSFSSLESDSGVKNAESKRKNSDSNSANLTVQQRHSTSNCDNSRTCNGISNFDDKAAKSPSKSSNCSPVKSKLNNPQKEKLISKGNKEKPPSENLNSYSHEKDKQPISNKGNNAFLFGTEVPTWREENHYRHSHNSGHEVRRTFDEYDNELDRGKVRKTKMKDRYRYFHQKNRFQKYADNYHGKYNNRKFFTNHHNYRRYDSHHNWKSNHRNNYRRYNQHHRY